MIVRHGRCADALKQGTRLSKPNSAFPCFRAPYVIDKALKIEVTSSGDPLDAGQAVEAGVETEDPLNAVPFHYGDVNGISRRHEATKRIFMFVIFVCFVAVFRTAAIPQLFFRLATIGVIGTLALGCGSASQPVTPAPGGRFDSDLAFLREHTQVVLLADPSGAKVAVTPEYQGRVMTSTTGGSDGPSFGWIGRSAVASRNPQPHMNVFGGEDRFWLGPEGGQFALYFKAGDPFDLDHWQVPEPIDWGAWEIESQSATAARFRERMSLVNYSRTRLDIDVDRTVRLLTGSEVSAHLGESPGSDVRTVGFESSNTVINIGTAQWQPESGLVSVWILGMFNPSQDTTIVIPFASGPSATHGPIVNDAYFGKVPADRLVVRDSLILFRGDGRYRSKIGLSPSRALSIAGSYDASAHVLTLVQYTRPAGATRYVNSMWEIQREPYKGDVINSYNDGPPAPGKPPLGPFYELETSSPALELAPGERYTHVQRTFHLVGAEADLDRIVRHTLKVGLKELTSAFAASASATRTVP